MVGGGKGISSTGQFGGQLSRTNFSVLGNAPFVYV